jgi:hypothetical protein
MRAPACNRRIRRLSKHLAGAARRQQRPRYRDGADVAGAADVSCAVTDAINDDELRRGGIAQDADASVRTDARPQHASDLAACRVARMKHAPYAVRRLTREGRRPAGVAIERRAPREQLDDVRGSLTDEHVDRIVIAEAVARGDRVLRMQRRRIVRAKSGGDATLCVAGIALGGIGFREDDDLSGFGEREGSAQSSDAAADHEEVSSQIHFAMLLVACSN